jgi:hypothetical protein
MLACSDLLQAILEVWKGEWLAINRRLQHAMGGSHANASVPWHLPISHLRVHLDAPLIHLTCNHVMLSEL